MRREVFAGNVVEFHDTIAEQDGPVKTITTMHYDDDCNESQSLSFAKARNRWESPFFFA